MKKLEATIRPFELDEAKENLAAIGIHNITVVDVRSLSDAREDDPELYLGENYAGYVIDFLPKVRIELVVEEAKVDEAAEAILKSSRNGKTRGHVFVYDIARIIK